MFTFNHAKPKKCLTRNCKGIFDKESCEGWIPLSPIYTWCVMRCPKCHDKFAIQQPIAIVEEYLKELPSRPKSKLPKITVSEVNEVHEALNKDNILKTLKRENTNEF